MRQNMGFSQEQSKKELKVNSDHIIVDWKQYCRDICVDYFTNHPHQISGIWHIVEIKERRFAKRKTIEGTKFPEQSVGFWRVQPEGKAGIFGKPYYYYLCSYFNHV